MLFDTMQWIYFFVGLIAYVGFRFIVNLIKRKNLKQTSTNKQHTTEDKSERK